MNSVIGKGWGKLRVVSQGNSLGAQLLKGGLGSLGLKICNKGLTLLVVIALARVLGPEGYGVYTFVLAVFTILVVPVKLGLPTLVLRETAGAVARRDYTELGALWHWSTRFVLAASVAVVVLGALALWAVHGRVDNRYVLTFAVGLPLVGIMGISQLRVASLRGLHRVVLGQVPEMFVRPVLLLVGIAAVVVLMPDHWLQPERAMMIYVLALVGSLVVSVWLLHACRPANVQAGKPAPETTRRWLGAVLPLALLAGVKIINKNTDLIMIGLLGTDAQVGIYRVAMQGGILIVFATEALNQVFMPNFSTVYAQGNTQKLQRLATAGTCATTLSVMVVSIIFWLFGPVLLKVAFGEEYVGAYVPLCILAVGRIVGASMGQLGVLLNMTGHEREALLRVVAALGVNIALNVALIPYFGMVGAATATAVSIVVLNVALWRLAYVQLHIDASIWSITQRLSVRP